MTKLKACDDQFWLAVEEIEIRTRQRFEPDLAALFLLGFSRLLDLLPADIIEVRLMTAVGANDKQRFPTATVLPGPLLQSLLAALRTGSISDGRAHIEKLLEDHLGDTLWELRAA